MKRAILAAVVILAACEPAPATPSAAPTIARVPTASPAPTARPAASPTASPTPEPTSRPGVRATAAGLLPESVRFVAIDSPLADGFRTRLWLVDLNARRPPSVVGEWDGPAAPVGEHSISADGRTVIVSAAGTRSRVALYLLRPQTGETRVLFEDPAMVVVSPRVSPDGERFAFTKYPAAGGSDEGIWTGSTTESRELVRIVGPAQGTSVPRMSLAWSADAQWLAYAKVGERTTEVFVVQQNGVLETLVGPGDRVSWRRNPPQLLVATNTPPTSVIYTFDLATEKAVVAARVEKLAIPVIQWHPSLDRFVFVESEGAGREASGGIWIRNADGTGGSRVDLGRAVFSPQWSRDGTLLTALSAGDSVTIAVVELFSGRQIAVLCRRGGTPPADCV